MFALAELATGSGLMIQLMKARPDAEGRSITPTVSPWETCCPVPRNASVPPNASRGRPSGSRRSLPDDSDTPFSPLGTGPDRAARLAFRLTVIGLIPGLGLLLGPAALALVALTWRRQSDPAFKAYAPIRAALVLGIAITVTNWAGLALMLLGWPWSV
jgi:hypothetical protein